MDNYLALLGTKVNILATESELCELAVDTSLFVYAQAIRSTWDVNDKELSENSTTFSAVVMLGKTVR